MRTKGSFPPGLMMTWNIVTFLGDWNNSQMTEGNFLYCGILQTQLNVVLSVFQNSTTSVLPILIQIVECAVMIRKAVARLIFVLITPQLIHEALNSGHVLSTNTNVVKKGFLSLDQNRKIRQKVF